MADLVAFLDESRKPVRDLATGRVSGGGEHYVVAAAVVIEGDTESVRGAIADVEGRLGFRLHYADLRSRKRRMVALAALDEIADWDGYLFETGRPLPTRHYSEHHIRATTLTAALTLLGSDLGITSIVLETRAAPKKGFTELDKSARK